MIMFLVVGVACVVVVVGWGVGVGGVVCVGGGVWGVCWYLLLGFSGPLVRYGWGIVFPCALLMRDG